MSPVCLRLVVVDDHALFRRGLVGLLEDMPEFQVVGEAGDGVEALDVIAAQKPDLVLLDVNMPRMDGVETVQALRARKINTRVLMLTISKTEEDLMGAIRAGADGYLLKNIEPDDLRKALLKTAEGQGVLSPEVTGAVMRAVVRPNREAQPLLSEREMEVLRCLAAGQTTHQISQGLFISENTVKTHVRHILEKLEAENRIEAVGKAIKMRLIHPMQ
ncbi:two component transcriptional regulator, LuxR family [Longilinea arvoryzae]|uniref:Two component transcriptional regulator, LuxR family n=1 Tax=Longilinea arvoryzae TaxID=360412 RepID=A0A0S7BJ78_9CHLR|nr:response regulator transcription factor [Longilinea arvoryzae]GAP15188.1 two component transcriptional regulator, LuxR family [Longilinea arvoryzae]